MPLHFEDVTVAGDGRPRLDDVSAAFPERGVTAISGPSGAGKSTLLRLLQPARGARRGRRALPRRGPRRARPARPPQGGRDGLPGAGAVRGQRRETTCASPIPAPSDEQISELLERAALAARFADREATRCRAARRQRVCLARALATDPEVLLMDEPTSSLDAEAAGVLERLMRELAAGDVPVLLVSTSEAQIERVADDVVRIDRGPRQGVERNGRG